MMNVVRGAIVLGLLCVHVPDVRAQQQARAFTVVDLLLDTEGGGVGGFIDWIHKLSGPGFIGPGVTLFWEFGDGDIDESEPGPRLRYEYARRTAIRKAGAVSPVTADITMETHQLTLELPIMRLPFYAGAGYARHRFSGDVDAFWHHSFPANISFRLRRPLVVSGWALVPVLKGSMHYFPKFDATDFAPLTVNVSRDDSEAVLQASFGLDFRPPFLRRR